MSLPAPGGARCLAVRVGIQGATIFAAGVVLVVGLGIVWARQPSGGMAGELPVPDFSTPAASAAPSTAAPARTTLLPTDCGQLLPGQPDMAALLGRPTGSVGVHTVRGVAAPSVRQLEKVSCSFTPQGSGRLTLTLGAFDDPTAAAVQRDRNIAAERSDTRSSAPAPLGIAQATLVEEQGKRLLMVAYERYTLTAALDDGVVPDGQAEPVLTDLAQRVLPALVPTQGKH
jgi:hypothetical protein